VVRAVAQRISPAILARLRQPEVPRKRPNFSRAGACCIAPSISYDDWLAGKLKSCTV
jgi:hypothetical protein